MIRHIVLVRFRSDVGEAAISAILAALGPLSARLGFAVAWGRSESPEQIERGYLHGFVADFRSWDHLASYQADAEHKAFGAALVQNTQGGLDGILVFDLAIQDPVSIT